MRNVELACFVMSCTLTWDDTLMLVEENDCLNITFLESQLLDEKLGLDSSHKLKEDLFQLLLSTGFNTETCSIQTLFQWIWSQAISPRGISSFTRHENSYQILLQKELVSETKRLIVYLRQDH